MFGISGIFSGGYNVLGGKRGKKRSLWEGVGNLKDCAFSSKSR